jgi:hypothetical protein
MAADVLGIPAAAVGLERQFSDARATGKYNRKYDATTFSAVMLLRAYYKQENDTRAKLSLSDLVDIAAGQDLVATTFPTWNVNRAAVEVRRRRAETIDVMKHSFISDDSDSAEDLSEDEVLCSAPAPARSTPAPAPSWRHASIARPDSPGLSTPLDSPRPRPTPSSSRTRASAPRTTGNKRRCATEGSTHRPGKRSRLASAHVAEEDDSEDNMIEGC